MKNIFLLILALFISCASQGRPGGGPVDTQGPSVINYEFKDTKKGKTIIIEFDEIIDPKSIVNSISINGSNNFNLKSNYNKVILSSLDDNKNIFELYIDRKISDYRGNIMASPIIEFFPLGSEISQSTISGQLKNIIDDGIYEVALFEVGNDSTLYIKKTQADTSGQFKFKNIKNGDYRLGAIEGEVDNFNLDYRIKRYGIQSRDIMIRKDSTEFEVDVIIDNPLPIYKIIGADMINGNYAILTLNDGSEKAVYIKPDNRGRYNSGDSIRIDINNSNRLENYAMNMFEFIASIPNDTIYPQINNYYRLNDSIYFNFSEPVQILARDEDKNSIFFNDSKEGLQYNIIDPFNVSVEIDDIDKQIYIDNSGISDFNNNNLDSLTVIDIPELEKLDQKFGSLKGNIDYNGQYEVAVRLTNNESLIQYHAIVKSGEFLFEQVIPGDYTLDSYEIKNDNFKIYHSGIWRPFEKSARFAIYPDNVDIRAQWIIEGLEIIYD